MRTEAQPGGVLEAIRRALAAGEPVTLETFGGEAGLSSDGPEVAVSPAFGDVVEALVGGWPSLSDRDAALLFLREGIIGNPNHDALSHALDALSPVAPGELRPLSCSRSTQGRGTMLPPRWAERPLRPGF